MALMKRSVIGTAAALSLIAFTGCGGGGGGGSSSGSTSSTFPELSNAVEAEATADNGAEATEIILTGVSNFSTGGLLAVSQDVGGGIDPVAVMAMFNHTLAENNAIAHSLNQSVSQTVPCSGGGSVSVSGNTGSSTVSATINYSQCQEGYGTALMTMNGKMSMSGKGSNYGETLTSSRITFDTDFTMSGTTNALIHKGSYLDVSFSSYSADGDTTSGTMSSSIWFEMGSYNRRYDDLTIAFSSDTWNGYQSNCYKAGRIYVSGLASYMDIDESYDPSCSDPFVKEWSLQSGSMQLLGNGNTVRAEVTSSNTITVTDSNGNTKTVSSYGYF